MGTSSLCAWRSISDRGNRTNSRIQTASRGSFTVKRIVTTCLLVVLATSWVRAESGCADCGAIIPSKLQCVKTYTKATAEVIEWGVVSDPVCKTRCRLFSCLPFGKGDCADCDGYCADGCDKTKPCRIRGRNRLMRRTLVEYIPVTDYVAAPVCQSCLYQRLETESVPAPEGAPVLAPLIDSAAVQKHNAMPARPVHWIHSETVPTGAENRSGAPEGWLDRIDLALPLRALTSPSTSRDPTSTYPVQR